MQRTSPLTVATFAVVGIGIGLLLQLVRSNAGMAPLVPPASLALTEIVLGGVLITLAISLRRAVTKKSGKAVNPFHAVRLLAGARAGQFVGALIGGFGAGLALQLLSRSVLPSAASWLPMLAVLVGGIVLVVCGVIAESLCRVPPGGDDTETPRNDGAEAEPGAA